MTTRRGTESGPEQADSRPPTLDEVMAAYEAELWSIYQSMAVRGER